MNVDDSSAVLLRATLGRGVPYSIDCSFTQLGQVGSMAWMSRRPMGVVVVVEKTEGQIIGS